MRRPDYRWIAKANAACPPKGGNGRLTIPRFAPTGFMGVELLLTPSGIPYRCAVQSSETSIVPL